MACSRMISGRACFPAAAFPSAAVIPRTSGIVHHARWCGFHHFCPEISHPVPLGIFSEMAEHLVPMTGTPQACAWMTGSPNPSP